ncbi:MAG TPA: hypothetical protein VMA74_09870, partial [Dyella sp.]|uniref:hypothetical protein n=1 Tax=Dyella sp. TaxID=1869338 RepID=UPI002CFA09CE
RRTNHATAVIDPNKKKSNDNTAACIRNKSRSEITIETTTTHEKRVAFLGLVNCCIADSDSVRLKGWRQAPD